MTPGAFFIPGSPYLSISARRMLGSNLSETLRYTSLNAADATKETVEPMLSEVAESLSEFRTRLYRG